MVDPRKYKALFVTESREILTSYQSELLEFERREDGREAMAALFRAAHSLKGMSASMGYERFAQLAHAAEDLADHGRQTGSLPAEAIDLLLETGDLLGGFVDGIEASEEPPTCDSGDLIERLQRLRTALDDSAVVEAADHPGPPPPAPGGLATSPAALGSVPARHGAPTVASDASTATQLQRVAVVISSESPSPQVRAFMLHRQLSKRFDIVEVVPSLDELKAGRFPDRTLKIAVRGKPEVRAALLEAARAGTDVARVEDLGSDARPADVGRGEADAHEPQRTVRVRTEILDEFIDSVGELLRARDRLRDVSERVDLPEVSEIADELVTLTKDLHDRVMAARMTPLAVLTERLPRVVRDLARRSGRPVDLGIEGADIELDRALLDDLHAAVIHVVRNSVDHGHEGSEARLAAGKPPTLSLAVRASRDRDRVLIEVEDDGGGIDPTRVRMRAVEQGLLDAAHADELSDAEAVELVCTPGLSTAEEVSEVSGRGVGMDVVRSTVERLGGELQLRSAAGQGTCVTMRLPLTMAIIAVMLVEVRGTIFAIPTNRVVHALDLDPDRLGDSYGERLVQIDGALYPFYDLGALLGYGTDIDVETGTVLLVRGPGGTVAARVDRIAGLQDIVVKPLGTPLAAIDFLAGAALLADGRPSFVLDVARLVWREALVA